jgi:hypothetical protein
VLTSKIGLRLGYVARTQTKLAAPGTMVLDMILTGTGGMGRTVAKAEKAVAEILAICRPFWFLCSEFVLDPEPSLIKNRSRSPLTVTLEAMAVRAGPVAGAEMALAVMTQVKAFSIVSVQEAMVAMEVSAGSRAEEAMRAGVGMGRRYTSLLP